MSRYVFSKSIQGVLQSDIRTHPTVRLEAPLTSDNGGVAHKTIHVVVVAVAVAVAVAVVIFVVGVVGDVVFLVNVDV